MQEQVQQSFPVVYSFDAHPSDDGATLAVEATCFDKTVVRFAVPVDNIQHMIAFLLIWVHMVSPENSSWAGRKFQKRAYPYSCEIDGDRRT